MTDSPPRPQRPERFAAGVLALAFLLSFVARGMLETYATFLLPLSAGFDLSRAQVASIYSVAAFIIGFGAPLVGVLFDRWGPRNLFLLGLGSLVLGLAGAAVSSALWQFQLCLGVLVGFAAVAIGPVPAMSLVSRWYRDRYTSAIGVLHASNGLGIFVMAPIAQMLIDGNGWRGAYGWLAVMAMMLVPVIMLVPWKTISAGRFEDSGQVRSGASRTLVDWTLWSAAKTVPFWCIVAIFLFTATGNFALVPQAVAILVEAGVEPLRAASLFGILGLTAVFGLLGYSRLADRIGAFPTAMMTFVGTLGGAGCLMIFHLTEKTIWLYGFIALFGPSMGSRFPLISHFANRVFGGPRLASIVGTAAMGLGIGSALGSYTAGLLHDWTGDYGATIVFAIVTSALGPAGFIVLRLRGVR